jgi:hypothetical protein
VSRRLRLRHAAALLAALGGIASALAILVLSELVDDLRAELGAVHLRVLARETVEEALDVIDVAGRTNQGGSQ